MNMPHGHCSTNLCGNRCSDTGIDCSRSGTHPPHCRKTSCCRSRKPLGKSCRAEGTLSLILARFLHHRTHLAACYGTLVVHFGERDCDRHYCTDFQYMSSSPRLQGSPLQSHLPMHRLDRNRSRMLTCYTVYNCRHTSLLLRSSHMNQWSCKDFDPYGGKTCTDQNPICSPWSQRHHIAYN